MAKQKRGTLTLAYGPMFSGKTSWLIDEYGDGEGVLAFKPDIDKRYTIRPVLRSHDNNEVPAVLLSLQDLSVLFNEAMRAAQKKDLKKILIDEINFFSDEIIPIIDQVLDKGVSVSVSGLLTDSDRQDFGPTRKLMMIADKATEFHARCDAQGCTEPAVHTYAKKKKETQVVVGASDMYGAVCSSHYEDLSVEKREDKLDLLKLAQYKVYPGYIDWLSEMKLPYIRQNRKITAASQPHIEIGGDSMRVGKTTALTVLRDTLKRHGLTLHASLEDWQHNPYVADSYGDSSETLLKSQEWFSKRKYAQLKNIDPAKTHIQDVHPEMDFCYALCNAVMGRMSLKQFEEYVAHFYALSWQEIPAPDLLIYLTISDDVLLDRAKKSAREFETIDETYFLVMKVVNRKWLEGAKKRYQVMEINTDNFDFSKELVHQEKLAQMVVDRLRADGWELELSPQPQWNRLVGGTWEEVLSKQIVILSGLPGSGKSYWAHKLRKELGYSYLSSDVVRLTKVFQKQSKFLDKDTDYLASREMVYSMLHSLILKRAKSGKRVVVDATYLGPQREELITLLREQGLLDKSIMIVVKSSEEAVIARVSQKGKLPNGTKYQDGWRRAYDWFVERLSSGEIQYPDESQEGIRVVEMWNN